MKSSRAEVKTTRSLFIPQISLSARSFLSISVYIQLLTIRSTMSCLASLETDIRVQKKYSMSLEKNTVLIYKATSRALLCSFKNELKETVLFKITIFFICLIFFITHIFYYIYFTFYPRRAYREHRLSNQGYIKHVNYFELQKQIDFRSLFSGSFPIVVVLRRRRKDVILSCFYFSCSLAQHQTIKRQC